jgi:hypothetical protein
MRKGQKQIIAVIIIILLLAVGAYGYVAYYMNKPTPATPNTTTQTVDDRISPLVTQGIIFEINRIRSRGILDVMMKSGSSWKNTPMFYFITDIDGKQYISKDVVSAGGASAETLFNTWDSIFMDNKIIERTPQEQQTSKLTLTIMERDRSGFLGRKYQDVEKEKINMVYDYKTGHWTGDDTLNDTDGYGHFTGANYEIWFNIYQTCYNYDEIPYWTKVNVYHLNGSTDYSNYDPNGDGIPITWDFKWGYDPFVHDNHSMADPDRDGLTNLEEYQMAKYYADPFHQDIYIESDGMVKGGFFDWPHVFWDESQQIIIERFAQHNICVYIDNGWPGDSSIGGGELLPHIDTISQDSGMMLQFYKWHFADDRKGIFRYLVIAHNSGFCHPSVNNRYDSFSADTSPYKMYIRRAAFTQRTQRLLLASAVMHELGHSLGIAPWTWGGNDNMTWTLGKPQKTEFLDKWGNYKSVMNYYYIFDKKLVDYSDGTHGPGDQNDWNVFDLTYFKHDDKYIEYPGFSWPKNSTG